MAPRRYPALSPTVIDELPLCCATGIRAAKAEQRFPKFVRFLLFSSAELANGST